MYYAESVLRPTDFVALRCKSDRDFRSGRCERDVLRSGILLGNETVVAPMGLDAPKRCVLDSVRVCAWLRFCLLIRETFFFRSCRGSYYLETNDQFPFARGLPSMRQA